MSINKINLTNELNNYGNVILCDENNSESFIVVMDNIITDVTTLKDIIETHILKDFQILKNIRMSDGKLKCLYVKN